MNAHKWDYLDGARNLRSKWQRGETAFGGWSVFGSAYTAEVLSAAGFDWIGVDMQHGLIDAGLLPSILQAAAIRRTPTLVRVPWNSPLTIMQALDAGAHGVIVPFINSADEAKEAVAACRYPPEGSRSWGLMRAGLSIGHDAERANADLICAVMIETNEALDAVDSIACVGGIDALFVGPRDLMLSMSTGTTSPVGIDALASALQRVVEACRAAGIVAGAFAPTREEAVRWAGLGLQMIAAPSESAMMISAAGELVAYLHSQTNADLTGDG